MNGYGKVVLMKYNVSQKDTRLCFCNGWFLCCCRKI